MKGVRTIIIAGVVTQVFAAGMWAQVIPVEQAEAWNIIERHEPLSQGVTAMNDNPLLTGYDVKFYGLDVEGKCTFGNQACLQFLGYESADDLVGKKIRVEFIGRQAQDWGGRPRKVYRIHVDDGKLVRKERQVF